MTIEEKVLSSLKDILACEPSELRVGLCSEVDYMLDELNYGTYFRRWLKDIVKGWPEYSGNPFFPVPHPKHSDTRLMKGLSNRQEAEWTTTNIRLAQDAYYLLDRWTGKYGASRRRLAQYLVDQLEAGEKVT